ncbi:MAG: hypothetical protein ACQEXB_18330 [Bacillota bacterium]
MNGILKRALESGQVLEMIYISEKGEISQRKVRIMNITPGSFKAYCFLKRQQRTFKISNVLSVGPVKNINQGA